MNPKLLVIGIGNPCLQDDRAGIEVVERLEAQGLPLDAEAAFTVGFEVLDKVMGRERAVIVDASLLGREPGSVLRAGLEDIFTNHALANSHAVTLGATLKMGYELFPEEMPRELDIFLIEAQSISEFTRECTPPVLAGVEETVSRIREMALAPAA